MIQQKPITLTEQIFEHSKLKQKLIYTSKKTGLKIFKGNIERDNFVGVASKNYDFRKNKPIYETIRTFVLPEGHKLRQKGIFEIFTQTSAQGNKRIIGLIDATGDVVSHGDKKNTPKNYAQLIEDIKSMSNNELDFTV